MAILAYNETGEQIDITPEAYRDKDWAKNISSADDLFKQYENAQGLIGRSIQIPGENATPEEMGKIFSRLGRPDSADGYEVKEPAGADEDLKGRLSEMKKMFHTVGLSKKQASSILEGFEGISKSTIEKLKNQQAEKDAKFDETVAKIFGDKAEESKTVARKLIDQFAPVELKEKMKELSAEGLTTLAAVLKGVSDKYISQDDLRTLSGNSGGGAKTMEDLRKEALAAMDSKEYRNSFDPQHDAAKTKVDNLYREIAKLQANKK